MCFGLIYESCCVYSKLHIELSTKPVDAQQPITQQVTQIYLKIRFVEKCIACIFSSYFIVCGGLCVGLGLGLVKIK